jgi:hypothetical protein
VYLIKSLNYFRPFSSNLSQIIVGAIMKMVSTIFSSRNLVLDFAHFLSPDFVCGTSSCHFYMKSEICENAVYLALRKTFEIILKAVGLCEHPLTLLIPFRVSFLDF